METTVKSLRQNGYKVRVSHYRKYWPQYSMKRKPEEDVMYIIRHWVDTENRGTEILPWGGRTVVDITTPDGIDVYGEAVCYATENYIKKEGVRVALEKAMAKLSEI